MISPQAPGGKEGESLKKEEFSQKAYEALHTDERFAKMEEIFRWREKEDPEEHFAGYIDFIQEQFPPALRYRQSVLASMATDKDLDVKESEMEITKSAMDGAFAVGYFAGVYRAAMLAKLAGLVEERKRKPMAWLKNIMKR